MAVGQTEFQYYLPGDSLLHRALPAVKLSLLPVTVALVFSSYSYWQLASLFCLLMVGCWVADMPWRQPLTQVWRLKYLLVATLLLHTLLTSGRVLWGIGWLSFDGLQVGGLIAGRLMLALLFAQLFSSVTTLSEMIDGVRRLTSGLIFVRRERIDRLLFTLGSVCHFLPLVANEGRTRFSSWRTSGGGADTLWLELQSMFDHLFAEVSRLAEEYVVKGNPFVDSAENRVLAPLGFPDLCLVAVVFLFVGVRLWLL